jgi:hypothetical protein
MVEVEDAAFRFGSVGQWVTWLRWHRAGLPDRLYGTLFGVLSELHRLRPLDIENVLNAVMDMAAIPEIPSRG